MYPEYELVPISALQHILYCERQCALIHLERAWEENRFTAEGRIMHKRVEEGGSESRGDVRVEYGVPLRSLRLGVAGIADVVEFHFVEGKWQPFPVEYKRGRPKEEPWDEVQLCAQAICLEEMTATLIKHGAIFYGKTRRRKKVVFDKLLREETQKTALRVHNLLGKGILPKGKRGEKCKRCSLSGVCLPSCATRFHSVERYLSKEVEAAGATGKSV